MDKLKLFQYMPVALKVCISFFLKGSVSVSQYPFGDFYASFTQKHLLDFESKVSDFQKDAVEVLEKADLIPRPHRVAPETKGNANNTLVLK